MKGLLGLIVPTAIAALTACGGSTSPQNGSTATGGSSSSGTTSSTGGSTGGATSGTGTGGSSGGASTGTTGGAFIPIVSTLSGNGTQGFVEGTGGPQGTSEFYWPYATVVDVAGNVYVADLENQCLRKLDGQGNSTIFAGTGAPGFLDGTGGPSGTARFEFPGGLAIDPNGSIYVVDNGNSAIRKVASDGSVTTFAGTGIPGFVNGQVGPGGVARLNFSTYTTYAFGGVCVDKNGNVYVSDSGNNAIRKVDSSGMMTTLAGSQTPGFVDDAPGTHGAARFNGPGPCTVDADGNIYVADFMNSAIRKIDPTGSTVTLAGTPNTTGTVSGTGGPNGTARVYMPDGVAVDPLGNVYASATFDDRVIQIDPTGNVTILVGGPAGAPTGTGSRDGPVTVAQLSSPTGVFYTSQGNLIVTDLLGNRVRVVQLHP